MADIDNLAVEHFQIMDLRSGARSLEDINIERLLQTLPALTKEDADHLIFQSSEGIDNSLKKHIMDIITMRVRETKESIHKLDEVIKKIRESKTPTIRCTDPVIVDDQNRSLRDLSTAINSYELKADNGKLDQLINILKRADRYRNEDHQKDEYKKNDVLSAFTRMRSALSDYETSLNNLYGKFKRYDASFTKDTVRGLRKILTRDLLKNAHGLIAGIAGLTIVNPALAIGATISGLGLASANRALNTKFERSYTHKRLDAISREDFEAIF